MADGDVLVVTQKIVSKAENCLVEIDPTDPLSHKPLVERESVRILRRRGELIISQTRHGFVCANAGIDLSNVERGQAALLPEDSDRSARRIRDGLRGRHGLDVAIIISDTFGRPWRRGLTDVAIGSAGVLPILDLRGTPDALGREMQVTEVCPGRRAGVGSRTRDGQEHRRTRGHRPRRRPELVRHRLGRRRDRPRPCRRPVPVEARGPGYLLQAEFGVDARAGVAFGVAAHVEDHLDAVRSHTSVSGTAAPESRSPPLAKMT